MFSLEEISKAHKLTMQTLDMHETNRKHCEPFSVNFQELREKTNRIREIGHGTKKEMLNCKNTSNLPEKGNCTKVVEDVIKRKNNCEHKVEKKSRTEEIYELVNELKMNTKFLSIAGSQLYAFNGKIYENITDKVNAAKFFKKILACEGDFRLFNDYSEIVFQLLSDPDISYDSWDELNKNRDVIIFQNGTYDVCRRMLYEGYFDYNDYATSILAIDYVEDDCSGKDIIDDFLYSFCNGKEERVRLFCEILGYCISGYDNKKACFYMLGVPDSGKSTVCRFIEHIVGSNLYMSCSISELNSKYATSEMLDVKICADEDVAINKPLTSEDVSLIKKITSSDKIRTRQIYQKAKDIRPECKLLWAGNGMFRFRTSEDLTPILNRMVIFPLDRAVPYEERNPNIIDELKVGRNYMIGLALNALSDLVERRFEFTEVIDKQEYFNDFLFEDGIDAFVNSECVLKENAECSSSKFYDRYVDFCNVNSNFVAISNNVMIPQVCRNYGLRKKNDGKMRKLVGIDFKINCTDILEDV